MPKLQAYNQFITQRIHNIISTDHYVVIMGTCGAIDACGYSPSGTSNILSQAPTGISNAAIDFHKYADNSQVTDAGTFFESIAWEYRGCYLSRMTQILRTL